MKPYIFEADDLLGAFAMTPKAMDFTFSPQAKKQLIVATQSSPSMSLIEFQCSSSVKTKHEECSFSASVCVCVAKPCQAQPSTLGPPCAGSLHQSKVMLERHRMLLFPGRQTACLPICLLAVLQVCQQFSSRESSGARSGIGIGSCHST